MRADASGRFTTTLTIPSVASGTYYIRADVYPYYPPAIASAPFTVTPPYIPEVTTVDVTASPTTVYADGFSYSTITATVKDQMNNPMQGVTVYFTTTLGTLSAPSAVTGINGKASVEITSTYIGTATVTATADTKTDSVDVEFIGVGGIGDVLLKLLGIKGEVEDIEAKLDGTVSSLITTINDKLGTFMEGDTVASLLYAIEAKLDDATRWVSDADLSSAVSTITSAISSAQSAIIAEIDANEAKIDAIEAKLDSELFGLAAIKGEVGAIYNWLTTDANIVDDSELAATESAITTAISTLKTQLESKIDTAKDDILTAITDAKNAIIADIESKLTSSRLANIDLIDDINTYLIGTVYPAITAIKTEIGDISVDSGRAAWTTLGVALDDIKDEIEVIDTVVDAIKAKTDTIDWADITAIKTAVETTIPSTLAEIEAKLDYFFSDTDGDGTPDVLDTDIPWSLVSIRATIDAIEAKLDLLVVDADLNGVPDFIEEISAIEAKLDAWFGTGGTYSETTQIEMMGDRLTSTSTGTSLPVKKAKASDTAQFTVTLSVDVTDAGDKATVRATFDGTNWVTLEELTTDGYKTITIAARGVEILYDDALPANVIIDWGITVIHAPGVTITWT